MPEATSALSTPPPQPVPVRRARAASRRPRRRPGPPGWVALLWLGPAPLLLAGGVLSPAVALVRAAVTRYSITGLGPGRARATSRRPRRRPGPPGWVALLWLGPALLLIAGVVIYPAVALVRASVTRYSITGLSLGPAGLTNYRKVLEHPDLGTVLVNTVL